MQGRYNLVQILDMAAPTPEAFEQPGGLVSGFRAYRDVINLQEVVEVQHRLVDAFGDAVTPLDPSRVSSLRRIEIMSPADSRVMVDRIEAAGSRYEVREITTLKQLGLLAKRSWFGEHKLSGQKFRLLDPEAEDGEKLVTLHLDNFAQLQQIEADRVSIFKAFTNTDPVLGVLPQQQSRTHSLR